MIYTIKNDKLAVSVSSLGAELQSITAAGGRQYLYDGSAIWKERAPVLFPIVGRLKDEVYEYGGRQYTLPGHGFAKLMEFSAEQKSGDAVAFTLRDTPQTRENYPFGFELKITYSLSGDTLNVDYEVTDTDAGEMYFSIGAHEGYRCPMDEGEQFTDYELIFEKTENVDGWKMEGPLRRGDLYPFMRDTDTVTLDYSYFATDAVVLTSHVSRALTLKSKKSGRGVEVKFPDFPMLGIWTRPNAPYICIEPWWGVCDAKDHNGRLEDRFGIQRLNGGEKFSCRHTIRPF